MADIFVSYSHEDESWRDQLLRFLSGGLFQEQDVWSDERIAAGQDWYDKIQEAMETARVAILLVSQDFIVSEFIRNHEVVTLLQRRNRERMTLLPLIVRPCNWDIEMPWIQRIQVRPKEGKPLFGRRPATIERELAAFAREISEIINPVADHAGTQGYKARGEERVQRSSRAPEPERRSNESPTVGRILGGVSVTKDAVFTRGLRVSEQIASAKDIGFEAIVPGLGPARGPLI